MKINWKPEIGMRVRAVIDCPPDFRGCDWEWRKGDELVVTHTSETPPDQLPTEEGYCVPIESGIFMALGPRCPKGGHWYFPADHFEPVIDSD